MLVVEYFLLDYYYYYYYCVLALARARARKSAIRTRFEYTRSSFDEIYVVFIAALSRLFNTFNAPISPA